MSISDTYLQQLRASIPQSEPAVAWAESQSGAVLLDVRSESEYADGVVPNALLLPRSYLELRIAAHIPDLNQAIRIFCASGQRSLFAAGNLRQMGYSNVASIQGGFLAWRTANLPVTALTNDPASDPRYARQVLLPDFGSEGQRKLERAKVLLVGAGGLGSPAALYLAAAGVGTIGIADDDTVEISNLQRQILHSTHTLGLAKTRSAEQSVYALNPKVRVETLPRITPNNVAEYLPQYDVIVDGSDNFATRFLLADACVLYRKPLVYGAVLRYSGQVSVFLGHQTDQPCYRCLYPAPPPAEFAPSCVEAGVLGVVPGIIGTLQACEAIKLICGIGQSLAGRLLLVDFKNMRFREVALLKDPECPNCGANPDPARTRHYDHGAVCKI